MITNLNFPIFLDPDDESVIDSGYREWIELREEELQLRDAALVANFWLEKS
jgi:hypothetical protein